VKFFSTLLMPSWKNKKGQVGAIAAVLTFRFVSFISPAPLQ
jgi:hypothetical protein